MLSTLPKLLNNCKISQQQQQKQSQALTPGDLSPVPDRPASGHLSEVQVAVARTISWPQPPVPEMLLPETCRWSSSELECNLDTRDLALRWTRCSIELSYVQSVAVNTYSHKYIQQSCNQQEDLFVLIL